MAKILSFYPNQKLGKENSFKYIWQEFNSLDKFTRFFIITYLLIFFATLFIATNYQIFSLYGQSKSQRLQEIAQLQEFHRSFYGISVSTVPTSTPAPKDIAPPLVTIYIPFSDGYKLPNKEIQKILASSRDISGVSEMKIYFDNKVLRTCSFVSYCGITLSNQFINQLAVGSHTIAVTSIDNSIDKNIGIKFRTVVKNTH